MNVLDVATRLRSGQRIDLSRRLAGHRLGPDSQSKTAADDHLRPGRRSRRERHPRSLGALLPEPTGAEATRDRWLASSSVRAFELGRSDPADFASAFIAEWSLALSPDEFLAEFTTWPRAFWPESLELIVELRAAHRVACLSNCNELHWRRFGGFAQQFDAAFSSHLLGHIKPDREVFEIVLSRLAVSRRRCALRRRTGLLRCRPQRRHPRASRRWSRCLP